MRWLVTVCLALILASGAVLQSQAASVIFHSKADNSYGWCAGYSYGRSESCAREQCLSLGTGCQLAIECDGGWSAAAFANDPWSGFGASCQWQDPGTARSIALLSCIYATHTLCYTSEAFNGSGRTASSRANGDFDTAWYVQSLLADLGYDIGEIDGEIGSKTRAAIKQVQTVLGLDPTGEADTRLVQLLLFNNGGSRRFVQRVVAEIDAADQKTVANYTYRYAGRPAPELTVSDELGRLADVDRLAVVASILTAGNAKCASPINSAPQEGAVDVWGVACTEQTYLIAFGEGPPAISLADGETFKPSPIVLNAPAAESDCASGEESQSAVANDETLKPSPLTVGGMAPGLEPEVADCPHDLVGEETKPSPVTIGARPPSN